MQLSAIVEALLIASQNPLPSEEIARLVRARVAEAEDVRIRETEEGKEIPALPDWLIALAATSPENVTEAIAGLNQILRRKPAGLHHHRAPERLEGLHPAGIRRIRPPAFPRPQAGAHERPGHGNARHHRLPPADHQGRHRGGPRRGLRRDDPETPRPRPDPHRWPRGTSRPAAALRNDRFVFRTLRHPLHRRPPERLGTPQGETAGTRGNATSRRRSRAATRPRRRRHSCRRRCRRSQSKTPNLPIYP